MTANRGYYMSDFSLTPMAVKTYVKKKFESNVMLWIVMSPTVLTSGRSMAVTARSYTDNCLEPHLVPFLNRVNTHYPHGGYIFCPDKASARISTDFLDNNNVRYVKKANNPTEVPRCRPIEEFFRLLATVSTTKIVKPKIFRT